MLGLQCHWKWIPPSFPGTLCLHLLKPSPCSLWSIATCLQVLLGQGSALPLIDLEVSCGKSWLPFLPPGQGKRCWKLFLDLAGFVFGHMCLCCSLCTIPSCFSSSDIDLLDELCSSSKPTVAMLHIHPFWSYCTFLKPTRATCCNLYMNTGGCAKTWSWVSFGLNLLLLLPPLSHAAHMQPVHQNFDLMLLEYFTWNYCASTNWYKLPSVEWYIIQKSISYKKYLHLLQMWATPYYNISSAHAMWTSKPHQRTIRTLLTLTFWEQKLCRKVYFSKTGISMADRLPIGVHLVSFYPHQHLNLDNGL